MQCLPGSGGLATVVDVSAGIGYVVPGLVDAGWAVVYVVVVDGSVFVGCFTGVVWAEQINVASTGTLSERMW